MVKYLIFWGIIFILAAIAECTTMQLIPIWFAVGALAAVIAALCGLGFTAQFAVFVFASFLLLLLTRPLLRGLKVKNVAVMNAQRDIGASAQVIEEINPALGTGRVRVNGVDWIAVSEMGDVIPKDSVVIISQIDGAKLVVHSKQTAAKVS